MPHLSKRKVRNPSQEIQLAVLQTRKKRGKSRDAGSQLAGRVQRRPKQLPSNQFSENKRRVLLRRRPVFLVCLIWTGITWWLANPVAGVGQSPVHTSDTSSPTPAHSLNSLQGVRVADIKIEPAEHDA